MTFDRARSPSSSHQQQLEQQLEQQLKRHWQVRTAPASGWATQWQQWGTAALKAFVPRSEPRISKTMTADGPQWLVYDPWGDRTHRFGQEAEVRAWLEQRYYLD